MKVPSVDQHEAGRRLHRVLMSIASQVEWDLSRIRESPEAGVHSLRRRMKKLGPILSLARNHVPLQTRQQIKRHLRFLKDAFAGQRDADVMKTLASGLGIPDRAVALKRPPRPRPAEVNARHARVAVKLREAVCSLPLQTLDWNDLATAFLRAWKKERNAWTAASAEPSAELLHFWRKRTKSLYCQMLLIYQITGRLTKKTKLAGRLGRWLGRHHDLDVLASCLTADAGRARRLKVIRRRQAKLRRRIFNAAGRLHDRPPAKNAKRLAEHMIAAGWS